MMDAYLHAIGDRVFWSYIKQHKFTCKHTNRHTVAYRTAFVDHYRHFGEIPPLEAKSGQEIRDALRELSIKTQARQSGGPESR